MEFKKFFVTFPIPYINGLLHLGHAASICRADFIERYKKLKNFKTLFPQAFHVTGSPIVAMAYRLKNNDEKIKKDLLMQHVPEKDIEKFKDEKYWVEYFVPKAIEALKKLNLDIDWGRTFTTSELDAHYNKFIEWQYLTLKEKGLIERGKHPVIYDPIVNKVIGDHDRPDDYVGISYIEGYIVKFKLDEYIIPCFTLRPETIFGVTNIWINPNSKFLIVKVDDEKWILPKTIVIEEIKSQEHNVEILEEIDKNFLKSKKVFNPVTQEEVPILESDFVDEEIGTGIVMSVPSHAPYDYIALKELEEKNEIAKECLKKMKSLFILEGFSEFPAKDIVEKMKINSTKEKEKLEKATKEIYSKEFYNAKTREIFGEFANKKIFEIKDDFVKKLSQINILIEHKTVPIRFQSRYGNKVIVKIVDQWFIKYSNQEWKEKAIECVNKMKFYPENIKEEIISAIKNLRDWAFTHKDIIGTRLPWDKEWFIESLSDSTIYMAFYTISHLIRKIEPEKLTKEFFDYLFLGKGKIESNPLIEEMKKEFEFYYPFDLRVTGKDLITNHIVFMIFHHVAIFEEKYWPKAVAVNGHVLINGEKMSKSKGNFIPILDAIEKYGVDPLRFALAINSFSGLDDINIPLNEIEQYKNEIEEWINFCKENYNNGIDETSLADDWFNNFLNKSIVEAENYYENLDFRKIIWLSREMTNKFKFYLKLNLGKFSKKSINNYIYYKSLILYPIIPSSIEKIFKDLNWVEKKEIDEKLLKMENYIENLIEDIKTAIKLSKKEKVEKIKIIIASSNKYDMIKKLIGKPIQEIRKELKFKIDLNNFIEREIEEMYIKGNAKFLEEEFKCKIIIEEEENSKEEKAKRSLPGKPAIVIF